jgi:hypothetical protein
VLSRSATRGIFFARWPAYGIPESRYHESRRLVRDCLAGPFAEASEEASQRGLTWVPHIIERDVVAGEATSSPMRTEPNRVRGTLLGGSTKQA